MRSPLCLLLGGRCQPPAPGICGVPAQGGGSRAGPGALQGLKPQQEGRQHSLFVLAQLSLPPQRSCGASQPLRVGGALCTLPPELAGLGAVTTGFASGQTQAGTPLRVPALRCFACWQLLAPSSRGQIWSRVWAGLFLSGTLVWLGGCLSFLCGSFPRGSHLYLLTMEEGSLVLEPGWQTAGMPRPLWLGTGRVLRNTPPGSERGLALVPHCS